MGKWGRQAVSWAAAVILAFCICNAAMFLYEVQPGWIERENGATLAIWDPGTALVAGLEGRGYYHVDSKGYLNDSLPTEPGYCVVVGASFTQGKEVENGKRYTDLLNDMLSEQNGENSGGGNDAAVSARPSFVYNVSQEGYYFPDIASGFYALTKEFPDAGTIVIETGKTFFSDGELEAALDQRAYDEAQNGENILATLSPAKRFTMRVKEAMPLLNILKTQAETVKHRLSEGEESAKGEEEAKEKDTAAYSDRLEPVLKMLREEFDGTLIIAYHPVVTICDDGSLSPVRYEETEVFSRLCRENGIIFMDATQAILDAYAEDYSVPYGFMNTTMGKGHFSQAGHRVMAEELYKILVGRSGQ